MDKTRTFWDKLFLIIKGLAMGAANKVPGVSGGVVAFVAGFYEEFIYSLRKFNLKAFKLLINGRFVSFYRYVNGRFLGLLFFGLLISYFSVSKLLDYFIKQKELYVWAWFFGMIIGSIYYIAKDYHHWNRKTIAFGILGALAGISLSFLDPAQENDALWFVFLCGILSVSGMTLPGLSGSFLLILMGNYVLLLVDAINALYDTISEVIRGNLSFIDDGIRLHRLRILMVFTLGSGTGLVVLSHLLSYVLKHFKNITTAIIIGFISGSLGVVWPWKVTLYKTDALGAYLTDSNGEKIIEDFKRYLPDIAAAETWAAIGFIFFGILVILMLGWYGKRE